MLVSLEDWTVLLCNSSLVVLGQHFRQRVECCGSGGSACTSAAGGSPACLALAGAHPKRQNM